jgi:hypothetical protein
MLGLLDGTKNKNRFRPPGLPAANNGQCCHVKSPHECQLSNERELRL